VLKPRGCGRALRHTLLLSHKRVCRKRLPCRGLFCPVRIISVEQFNSRVCLEANAALLRGGCGWATVQSSRWWERPQELQGWVRIITGLPLRLLRRAQYKITQDRRSESKITRGHYPNYREVSPQESFIDCSLGGTDKNRPAKTRPSSLRSSVFKQFCRLFRFSSMPPRRFTMRPYTRPQPPASNPFNLPNAQFPLCSL